MAPDSNPRIVDETLSSSMKEQSLGSSLLSRLQCSGPSGWFGRIIAVPLAKLLAGLLSEEDLPQLFQGRIYRLRSVGLRLAHARCLLLEAQDRLRRYGELTRHDFNQAPPKALTNSLRWERRGTWSGSSASVKRRHHGRRSTGTAGSGRAGDRHRE